MEDHCANLVTNGNKLMAVRRVQELQCVNPRL